MWIFCADQKTPELEEVREKIAEAINISMTGYTMQGAVILNCNDIIRVFTEGERVYAECEGGVFSLKKKLYEVEEILSKDQFVRISRSELVNVRRIKRLDTSITGTIKMYLQGNIETYVSRRNVTKIKTVLGI